MTLRARTQCGSGLALLVLVLMTGACAGKRDFLPTGTLEADRFLFEKGQDLLSRKKWITGREYFQQIIENYPQSTYRPDAKLGLGDCYIGENSIESLIMAQNEFKEFLTFYPTHARADYAQYRLGYSHFKQMRAAERDQTETREAVIEWQLFVSRYPNSALMPEVKARLREARDRYSEADYRVGFYYYRVKWYIGAIDRFKAILKNDPEYTRRDAVYFYLAESLFGIARPAEALPYYDKIAKEFAQSEFLDRASKQVTVMKAMIEATPTVKTPSLP